MQFYNVRSRLIRRVKPNEGMTLEASDGTAWSRYLDVDALLGGGIPLDEAEAVALLVETRDNRELNSVSEARALDMLYEGMHIHHPLPHPG